jgi:hypothetical protein
MIRKILMIGLPILVAVLNILNYEGAEIMQPDMDELASSIASAVAAACGISLVIRKL